MFDSKFKQQGFKSRFFFNAQDWSNLGKSKSSMLEVYHQQLESNIEDYEMALY